MTDDAIMDLLNTDKISIFIENIGDFIKSDYFKNLTPYALKGIEYSLKERNIPKECQNDIIEFLERLANSQSQTALRNQVYYREKLYWHLIARKITNPNDKMNISIIIEHLWHKGDTGNHFFDEYSNIEKLKNDYKDNKIQFSEEYLKFFDNDFLDILKNGLDIGIPNYKDIKTPIFIRLMKEAFRILQRQEYLSCVSDDSILQDTFKEALLSIEKKF